MFRLYDVRCFIFLMEYNESNPSLKASIVILLDLDVRVILNGIELSRSSFENIVKKKLTHFSQVLNLLAFVKSSVTETAI